jgi:SAM-dependent methyltransferase
MSYNVSSTDFWKSRIEMAKSRGKIHHSIYELDDGLWGAVEYRHMTLIKKHVQPTDSVLDIGCGYGRLSRYFDTSLYEGVDFSQDFLDIAKENFPNHTYTNADLKKLPYKHNQFEWGVGVSIKWMIQRELGEDAWNVMEKELRRVCKNLIFLEYSDGQDRYLVEDYEVINCED